jgi:hypothetical protein
MRLAFPKGRNRVGVFLPSPENGNSSSARNVVFSTYLEFRTMNEVKELVILIVIHHRQNPLESTCWVMYVIVY